MSDFESRWQHYRAKTEQSLSSRLPQPDSPPQRLHQAMRYSCLDGGKRFRAMLVYACGEIAGARPDQLDVPAAAVEMIHAYSLTHDDLPAMDDDELRRGRETCHIAYDEATAILAGDALQTLAFEILSSDPVLALPGDRRLEMVATLAAATGPAGMAGGQALDMEATGGSAGLDDLETMHSLKTGALIRASARLGGLTAPDADEKLLSDLDRYAGSIGLAFQIADDILDETVDSETLGKPAGTDARNSKATYVSVLGVDGAREAMQKMHQNALESAARLGDNSGFLLKLADFVVNRSY